MVTADEAARRSTRVMTGFMDSGRAAFFGNQFVLDLPAFNAAHATALPKAGDLPQTYTAPRLEPIPADGRAHADALMKLPAFSQIYPGAEIQMIELAKVVAIQYSVDIGASDSQHGPQGAVDTAYLMSTCLPLSLTFPARTFWRQESQGCIFIHCMNNTFNVQGMIPNMATGQVNVVTGCNTNLMLVREHQGRHVLVNGYHRAWKLMSLGVEMAPVVVMKGGIDDFVGPGFLDQSFATAARPPTIHDYLNADLSQTFETRSMMKVVKITAESFFVPRLVV